MTEAAAVPPIRRSVRIAVDHPAFDGHFPGRPILPGVALLAEVVEAARDEPRFAAAIGERPRLPVAKFLGAVGPGAALTIEFGLSTRTVEWQVSDDAGRLVASGRFGRADLAAST